MSEPRAVNPGLAAGPGRPLAGAAVDAPAWPPEPAQGARSSPADPADPSDPGDPIVPIAPIDLVDRERWLFRHVTRAGQVHPLRHLLKRYRAGNRG